MITTDRNPNPRPGHVGDLTNLICDKCGKWFGANADFGELMRQASAAGWRQMPPHPISGRKRHRCPECDR